MTLRDTDDKALRTGTSVRRGLDDTPLFTVGLHRVGPIEITRGCIYGCHCKGPLSAAKGRCPNRCAAHPAAVLTLPETWAWLLRRAGWPIDAAGVTEA